MTLFESAARISEIPHVKFGDVEFHSVRRKDGGRGLVATLYLRAWRKSECFDIDARAFEN